MKSKTGAISGSTKWTLLQTKNLKKNKTTKLTLRHDKPFVTHSHTFPLVSTRFTHYYKHSTHTSITSSALQTGSTFLSLGLATHFAAQQKILAFLIGQQMVKSCLSCNRCPM